MLSLSGLTEVVKSIESRDSQLYTMESNKLNSASGTLERNQDSSSPTIARPQSIDMPSVLSMEILESHGRAPNVDPSEVMHRVTEMNRILKDAERYLHEFSGSGTIDSLDRKTTLHGFTGLDELQQETQTKPNGKFLK